MLKTRIIPCLDVKAGRVVKGVRFVDLQDAGSPVEAAAAYDRAGADELCFLDITASHEKRPAILDVVRQVAQCCFMPLTVGGGVRTVDDIQNLLRAGADKVAINTSAITNPALIDEAARRFGSQCIVVALDARQTSKNQWSLWTHGGRNPTQLDAAEFARTATAAGAGEILLTSMDRDGTKSGFDCALTRAVVEAVNVPVIASGGAGGLDDFVEIVREGGAHAVLAASVFHFGEFSIAEAKNHMEQADIPMRL